MISMQAINRGLTQNRLTEQNQWRYQPSQSIIGFFTGLQGFGYRQGLSLKDVELTRRLEMPDYEATNERLVLLSVQAG